MLKIRSLCFLGAILLISSLSLHVCIAEAASFKLLYSFAGGQDGCYPGFGSLVLDGGGNLYGTTQGGACGSCGTVFEVSNGSETVLYKFACGSNGDTPNGLFRDAKGNLYGTTEEGGGNSGCGVVFEVTAGGKEKTLHTFAGPPDDGCTPFDSLVRNGRGALYGTTTGGGNNRVGTVFKFAKDGTELLLHSFNETRGGCSPFAGLTIDRNENLFGTAQSCGSRHHAGAVFELSHNGRETVLYKFKGSPSDGSYPDGTLIRDASGNFYGTLTESGVSGCDGGCGAVFKLAPNGNERILHFFKGGSTDGGNPWGGVIADSAGNLYGTTSYGGGSGCGLGCGTVIEIAVDGTESILHSFDESDGSSPLAGLVTDAAGNLYGTAEYGGANGFGTVFEITP